MKVVEKGHVYLLNNKLKGTQKLTFFKDLPKSENGHDGILTQELFRVALNRLLELFEQKPCQETMEIILHCREILKLFEKRAFGNTLDKCYSKIGLNIEELPVKRNGHVFDL